MDQSMMIAMAENNKYSMVKSNDSKSKIFNPTTNNILGISFAGLLHIFILALMLGPASKRVTESSLPALQLHELRATKSPDEPVSLLKVGKNAPPTTAIAAPNLPGMTIESSAGQPGPKIAPCPAQNGQKRNTPPSGCPTVILSPPVPMWEAGSENEDEQLHEKALARLTAQFGHGGTASPSWERDRTPEFSTDGADKLLRWEQEYLSQ